MGLDDGHLSRRSLVDFRGRLVACDPEMARLRGVCDRLGAEALQSLELSTADQRLDSTHITSNIQSGGRVSLCTADTAADTPPPSAPVTVLAKPAAVSPSLQSPHDPDAAYGHKGVGCHVQITETCQAGALEGPKLACIITDFDVQPAHINDCGRAAEVLERLQARGLLPKRLFADGGYASGASLLHAESLGVDLYAPVTRARMPADTLGREAFDLAIEATNSEMKRSHGLGKLPVQRLSRVRLDVTCKLIACNIKRWLRALQEAAQRSSKPLWPAVPALNAVTTAVAALTRRLTLRALRHLVMHHRPALRAA